MSLLQLIGPTTDVYLMKKGISEIEVMDEAQLMETYTLCPQQIIDLKALMGDSADNIPGVKGIGEKTAIKLLKEYQSVDNVYEHIAEIKGKLKEKLENGKESAFLSKFLATIKTDAKIPVDMKTCKRVEPSTTLHDFFVKYEMNSFAKASAKKEEVKREGKRNVVPCVSKELLVDGSVLYANLDAENYYDATLYGFAIAHGNNCEYISLEDAKNDTALLEYIHTDNGKIVYDAKNVYHAWHRNHIAFVPVHRDVMLEAFLLDGMISDYDKLAEKYAFDCTLSKEDVFGKKGKPKLVVEEDAAAYAMQCAENLANIEQQLFDELEQKDMKELYDTIEMPVVEVLYAMEKEGAHQCRNLTGNCGSNGEKD